MAISESTKKVFEKKINKALALGAGHIRGIEVHHGGRFCQFRAMSGSIDDAKVSDSLGQLLAQVPWDGDADSLMVAFMYQALEGGLPVQLFELVPAGTAK